VNGYAQMWPRGVFDLWGNRELRDIVDIVKAQLKSPGVYVLYRDDEPHYIGKTGRKLCGRIWEHAHVAADRFYNFWNFFSAFEVHDPSQRDEVEAVLIAAMPSANSAKPKIPPVSLPREVIDFFAKTRRAEMKRVISTL